MLLNGEIKSSKVKNARSLLKLIMKKIMIKLQGLILLKRIIPIWLFVLIILKLEMINILIALNIKKFRTIFWALNMRKKGQLVGGGIVSWVLWIVIFLALLYAVFSLLKLRGNI